MADRKNRHLLEVSRALMLYKCFCPFIHNFLVSKVVTCFESRPNFPNTPLQRELLGEKNSVCKTPMPLPMLSSWYATPSIKPENLVPTRSKSLEPRGGLTKTTRFKGLFSKV